MEADDPERAEMIAVLSHTTDMVSNLLDMLDRILQAVENGQPLAPADIARYREHAALWRERLARVQQRIDSATIEPPRRVQ